MRKTTKLKKAYHAIGQETLVQKTESTGDCGPHSSAHFLTDEPVQCSTPEAGIILSTGSWLSIFTLQITYFTMYTSFLYRMSTIIGFSSIFYFAYKASLTILFNLHTSKLKRYLHPHRRDKEKQEAWALVTGASSGIGLTWVHQLAARKFNVILHGRNDEKLEGIIAELEEQYEVGFKSLVLDSQTPTGPQFDETVLACVRGLNLTVVIHNVGGPAKGHYEMVYQDKITAAEVDGWIDINARFATHITRLLLPPMIENQPGLMLYISSGVTQMTVPSTANYASAKAYLESYAKILAMEMRVKGYDIELKAFVTGTCVTSTSGRTEKDRSFTMPLTEDYVTSAINKIGWNEVIVTPWIGHQVQLAIMTALPDWLYAILIGRMLKQVEAGFKEAQKKN